MQPLNQVEERIDRERSAGFSSEFTDAMAATLPAGWHPVMSFRIGDPHRRCSAEPPSPGRGRGAQVTAKELTMNDTFRRNWLTGLTEPWPRSACGSG